MVEKYNIRTDLALEEKERFEADHVEVQGVILTEEYDRKRSKSDGKTGWQLYYDRGTGNGSSR